MSTGTAPEPDSHYCLAYARKLSAAGWPRPEASRHARTVLDPAGVDPGRPTTLITTMTHTAATGAELTTDAELSAEIAADEAANEQREQCIADTTQDISFQLHYTRSPVKRVFSATGLTGASIDNAYSTPTGERPMAPGNWDDDTLCSGKITPETVQQACFSMAVNESVHEALEWFRIGDRPALDPHGSNESAIFEAVAELVDRLWKLRTDTPKHAICVRIGEPLAEEPDHIRDVEPDGLKTRHGRIEGAALCSRDLGGGWDTGDPLTPDVAQASLRDPSHSGLCRTCCEMYLRASR